MIIFSVSTCMILASIYAASFNCNQDLNEIEKSICNNSYLSSLDELMSDAYKKALKGEIGDSPMVISVVKENQKSWIKERNKCQYDYCIAQKYLSRIMEISSDAMSIKTRSVFSTYFYTGTPENNICTAGSELTEWGHCVQWAPDGGPSFEGITYSGKMAFNFFYIGGNYHTCSVSGLAHLKNDSWIFEEESYDGICSIKISFNPNGLDLEANYPCNSFCGVRAAGGINQEFTFK